MGKFNFQTQTGTSNIDEIVLEPGHGSLDTGAKVDNVKINKGAFYSTKHADNLYDQDKYIFDVSAGQSIEYFIVKEPPNSSSNSANASLYIAVRDHEANKYVSAIRLDASHPDYLKHVMNNQVTARGASNVAIAELRRPTYTATPESNEIDFIIARNQATQALQQPAANQNVEIPASQLQVEREKTGQSK